MAAVLVWPFYQAHRRSSDYAVDEYPKRNSEKNGIDDIRSAHITTGARDNFYRRKVGENEYSKDRIQQWREPDTQAPHNYP